jgi:tetratricopeptide (TPR) repeat protein
LAGIYKQLIGVVDGTADWSYQAYQQAVVYDPTNPLTRLDMGGLLFAAQRYEEAGRVFEQVVRDKQDFANAWYNLAYADKALNKIDVAVADLQQAVSLVPKDSGDYEKANKELDVWKKELDEAIKKQQELLKQQQAAAAAAQPKEPETLKAPEVAPKVGEEEKVNVPAEQIQPPEVTPLPTQVPETETSPAPLPQ